MTPPPSDALPREVHEHLRRLTRKFCASRRVVSDLDFALEAAYRLGLAQQAGESARLREALEEAKRLYNELLYEVVRKHPGETRHETARRYIRQAEIPKDNGPVAAAPSGAAEREPTNGHTKGTD